MIATHSDTSARLWVKWAELLDAAGLTDAKAAAEKCDAAGIAREPIGSDRRVKYIQVPEIPAFFQQYTRPTAEQSGAFARILSELGLTEDVEFSPIAPETSGEKPGKKNGDSPPKKPGNGGKNAGNTLEKWRVFLRTSGDVAGEFYASPFFAYLVLSVFLGGQAALHANAAWRSLPGIPAWEVLLLAVLMQLVVLIGTMHSSFFGASWGYWVFLGAFALYDTAMNYCNFFYDFQAGVDSWVSLTVRLALTVGFPLATLFYASLVKKIRA